MLRPSLNTRSSSRIGLRAVARLATRVLALTALASACSPIDTATPDPGSPDASPTADAPDGQEGEFRSCLDGTMPADLPTVDWSHWTNDVITLATPWHSAQDILATPGAPIDLAAKFSYGSISKDLEDERIEVWIDDCAGGYTRLGERVSDSDGRIAYPLAANQMPGIGEYKVHFRVMGDNTGTFAILRVYPPSTQFIVFDIDATLTTSDSELVGQVVSEILDNNVIPEARQGAREITSLRHNNHHYEIIYLTGRPYLLTGLTRDWLDDLGFPGGTVRLTDSVAASWPSDSAVGQYKADFLIDSVNAQSFSIHAAYGNATSDIYAYEQAGVAKERTYILGEHGGESLTVALGEAYTDHIETIRNDDAAVQPFHRASW